jgi:hypothetical protein
MNELLQLRYDVARLTSSDINEHIPVLKKYSSECDVVVEAGVRWITSTWGLMAGLPRELWSIDIDDYGQDFSHVQNIAEQNGVNFKFELISTVPQPNDPNSKFSHLQTLSLQNKNVDLLFIDTCHTYDVLTQELQLHAKYVKQYLIFHDTEKYGNVGEDGRAPGLWQAIEEFLTINSQWILLERYKNNNGLTVLKRKLYNE